VGPRRLMAAAAHHGVRAAQVRLRQQCRSVTPCRFCAQNFYVRELATAFAFRVYDGHPAVPSRSKGNRVALIAAALILPLDAAVSAKALVQTVCASVLQGDRRPEELQGHSSLPGDCLCCT